jgi:hypothetical protein
MNKRALHILFNIIDDHPFELFFLYTELFFVTSEGFFTSSSVQDTLHFHALLNMPGIFFSSNFCSKQLTQLYLEMVRIMKLPGLRKVILHCMLQHLS